MEAAMECDLHQRIEREIPRLRRYARALTRNETAADDLVQDCLVRGLSKLHLWQEGTDLRAWLFTILHNQHVNNVRRGIREGAAVAISETEPSLTCLARQEKHLDVSFH
jgi:RNA polymerase sigma-70 factor, ECF subfamily